MCLAAERRVDLIKLCEAEGWRDKERERRRRMGGGSESREREGWREGEKEEALTIPSLTLPLIFLSLSFSPPPLPLSSRLLSTCHPGHSNSSIQLDSCIRLQQNCHSKAFIPEVPIISTTEKIHVEDKSVTARNIRAACLCVGRRGLQFWSTMNCDAGMGVRELLSGSAPDTHKAAGVNTDMREGLGYTAHKGRPDICTAPSESNHMNLGWSLDTLCWPSAVPS